MSWRSRSLSLHPYTHRLTSVLLLVLKKAQKNKHILSFAQLDHNTITMQFSSLATLALASTVLAAPQPALGPVGGLIGSLGGGGGTGNTAASLPAVPSGTTLGSAINTCGNNAQLSCCNKADTSGDSVSEASGVLSGLLQGLGNNLQGVGLFDQCSKLSVTGC
jgi:hypothetical protein